MGDVHPLSEKAVSDLTQFRDGQTGRFIGGNPGRPSGARNHVNAEFSAALRAFLEQPTTAGDSTVWREIVLHLLGSPDDTIVYHTFKLAAAYSYGKPPETLNIVGGKSMEDVLADIYARRKAKDAESAAASEGQNG